MQPYPTLEVMIDRAGPVLRNDGHWDVYIRDIDTDQEIRLTCTDRHMAEALRLICEKAVIDFGYWD